MGILSCCLWIPLLWRRGNDKVSFEDLPDDVVIDILSRLPAASVVRYQRVCKRWLRLMSTTSFAELHAEKAKPVILLRHENGFVHIEEELKNSNKSYQCVMRRIRLGDMSPRCSCNGLLLFMDIHMLFIWNPITREKVSLPVPGYNGFVCAFFFHPIHREYMVLFHATGFGYCWFEMLSLRTRSWRRLHQFWKLVNGVGFFYPYSFTPPVVVCGAMHWVFNWQQIVNCWKLIMRLNLQTEQFELMPLPDNQSFSGKERFYMVEMEKRLSLCSVWGDSFDVWILMDYEKWDWVKRYSIRLKSNRPQHLVHGGCWLGDIRIVNGYFFLRWYGNGLYICDLQKSKLRRMDVKGIDGEHRCIFEPHFNTCPYRQDHLYHSVAEPHVNTIISLQNLYGYSKKMGYRNRNFPPLPMPPLRTSILGRIDKSLEDGFKRLFLESFLGRILDILAQETITVTCF